MANIKWSAFPSGGDMQVGDQTVGLRGGLNYRFTFPSVGIKDASGNYLVGWTSVGAGAVNYVQITNSATLNAPVIAPVGTDASIGLNINAVGTGVVTVGSNLILNTSAPTLALQAASKGYVDGLIPTFPISLAHGGTSANLTASNGGIFYSTSTAGAILSGTATANQVLLSGTSSAPSWSTATYPATTTVSQLLYSSSANTIAGLATANNGTLVTSNTGVPSILAGSGVTGNLLMSNAAAAPAWSTAVYSNTYTANNLLYASSTNNVSGLATANNGVLITSGAGVPSISSTLPSAVQGNITSLGTITSGTWNATIIAAQYGGTGVNNGSSTITLGGSLTTSGAFASTFTMTGITSVTFPTSGTLATTSQLPANPLPLSQGGTNANNTASNGGIVYSSASALNILAGTATANQIILSGSNTTPSWSTATYPATTTINQLLYSSSANTIAGLATATTAVLTTSSGVPIWASQLSLTLGGTNASLTASNGGIFYSTASAGAILAGTATAGQHLQSGASAAPSWTTATFPSTATSAGTILRSDGTNWVASTATFANTYAASTILYSNGANTVTGLATANSAVLVTNSSGVPAWSGTMTNGQLIIGSTTATPTAATLTAGTGITITNGAASITIATTGGGMGWTTVSGTSQSAAVNNGYITNNAGAVTVTLPTTFAIGDVVIVKGLGAGGWVLAAGTATTVRLGSSVTSSAGSLTSANQYDTVKVTGLVANTTWSVDYAFSAGLTVA